MNLWSPLMSWHFDEGKDRIPDEEDIYGVNDQNEHDYEVWMPFEDAARRRKKRIRFFALIVIVAFALAFALVEFRTVFGW